MNLKNIFRRGVNYGKIIKKMELYLGEQLLLTSDNNDSSVSAITGVLAGALDALIGSLTQPPNELKIRLYANENLNAGEDDYVDSYTLPKVVDKTVAVIAQSVGLGLSSALLVYSYKMLKNMKKNKNDLVTSVESAFPTSSAFDNFKKSPVFKGLNKALRRQKLRISGHVVGGLLNLPYGLRSTSYGSVPKKSVYGQNSIIEGTSYLPSLILSLTGMAISSLDYLLTKHSLKKNYESIADKYLKSINDLTNDEQKTIVGLALLLKNPQLKDLITDTDRINNYLLNPPNNDNEAEAAQKGLLFLIGSNDPSNKLKVEYEINDPSNPSYKKISFWVETDDTGNIINDTYLSKDDYITYFLEPLSKAMGV